MTDLKRYLDLSLPVGQSAFLWGPRKAGKSTFLKKLYPNAPYYDLLNSSVYLRLLDAPYTLRQELSLLPEEKRQGPVIIDEVQKIPLLLDEVHSMIEGMKPLSFILCGSSTRKLRRGGANFLGGRAWRFSFMPLVFPELPNFDLLHIFKTGLLPSHFLNLSTSEKSIKSYINDYLIQEIQYEGSVRNLRAFMKFLDLMAFSQGEIINFSNIARDCAVDSKTIKSYFEILQDMLLGFFVEPYVKTPGRDVMTAHPRFYFFDVGIANRLAHRKIAEIKGPEAGRAFEHYLFYEINAYKNLNDLDFPIRYWRTKTGIEVDFILGDGEVAIESKISPLIQKRDLQGLITFHNDNPNAKLYVVCLEPKQRLMTVDNKQIHIVPIKDFLENLWDKKVIQ